MSDSDNRQGKSLSRAKIIMILGIVASIVLMADILLLWHDGFVGIMLSAYLFWLIIPSFIVFLIAFVKPDGTRLCSVAVWLFFCFFSPTHCFEYHSNVVTPTSWQSITKNIRPKWWNCANTCNLPLPTALR